MVTVQTRDLPDAVYEGVTPALAEEIIERHAIAGKPPHELPAPMPFLAKQQKIVLANSGRIDPEEIDDYLAQDGYRALDKVLHEMTPEEACAEIKQSGLAAAAAPAIPPG
jgi:bidirectional [NiFe] hydrogenase diaphorase subunit